MLYRWTLKNWPEGASMRMRGHLPPHWRNTRGLGPLSPPPGSRRLWTSQNTSQIGQESVLWNCVGERRGILAGILRYVRAQKWGGGRRPPSAPLPGKWGGRAPPLFPPVPTPMYSLISRSSLYWILSGGRPVTLLADGRDLLRDTPSTDSRLYVRPHFGTSGICPHTVSSDSPGYSSALFKSRRMWRDERVNTFLTRVPVGEYPDLSNAPDMVARRRTEDSDTGNHMVMWASKTTLRSRTAVACREDQRFTHRHTGQWDFAIRWAARLSCHRWAWESWLFQRL